MQDLDLSFLVPCFFNCTPSYHLLLSSFSSFLPPSIVLLTFPTTLVQKAFPYKIIAIVLTMMEQMCAILTSFTTIFFITSLYFQGSLCWAFSIAASSSVSTKSSLTSPQHNNHLMISNCKTKSSITTSPLNEQEAKRKLKSKTCVLICPAQFCVPADYIDLVQHVQQISSASGNSKNTSIGCCKVAPLPRTEWIKVAKQIFSKDFFRGTLRARITLDWYFAAMEDALASIYAQEGEATNVCLVGHSIGGWVARAYLGGLSG